MVFRAASSVASIDQNGVLTANNVGTTVAIARSNSDPDVYGMINVVVVRGLLSLSVDPDEKAIYVGDRFTITPSLLPEGSAMPPVTYEATSADPTMPVSLTTSVASGVTLCKVTGMAAGNWRLELTIGDQPAARADLTVVQTNWMKNAVCEQVRLSGDRIVVMPPQLAELQGFAEAAVGPLGAANLAVQAESARVLGHPALPFVEMVEDQRVVVRLEGLQRRRLAGRHGKDEHGQGQ